MDTEIEELKVELEKQRKVAEDTNRVVHSMRRSARFKTFFSIVWWLLVLSASGAAYYYYVQPYVDQVLHAYGSFQNFEQQIGKAFGSSHQ